MESFTEKDKIQKKLPKIFQSYFDQLEHEWSSSLKFFIFRKDGMVLYSTHDEDQALLGALMGGLWQAASSLTALIPTSNPYDDFRLSFDTASKGMYVLPFTVGEDEFCLSLIYFDQVNPAPLKCQIRKIVSKMINYINDCLGLAAEDKGQEILGAKISHKDKLLFKDLSDSEIDNLFSFG